MKQILVELKEMPELNIQVDEIIKTWESGKYKQVLFHIYSGMEAEKFTAYAAKRLQKLFPEADIVGTMSAGEIMDGHLIKKGILIGALFLESTTAEVFRYDNVKGNEPSVGRKIKEQLDSISEIKAAELLLPGTEFDTKELFDEIDECDKSIRIFGGYSGGHTMNSPVHYVFDASGIMFDSILVTTFAGSDFHIDIDKVTGWEPLGVPFTVTKADGHKLIELNDRPASGIYEKFLEIDRKLDSNAKEGYTFPLLAEYNGEEWLRSAIHIEEDGSLNMHGSVMEGMDIQLSYGNPASIVKQVNERLEKVHDFKPQAIFIYSCIVRKAFWERYVDLELKPFGQLCSTTGFYTWGEVIRDTESGEIVEHNVTQLSIAMREGEPSDEELPAVQVDDSILKGPAAQMRRLTSLVYTTMEELQKAQKDLQVLNEKLRLMADRDALTGLFNRGKTEDIIYGLLDETAKNETPLSLLMIDIDYFKSINDEYGHHTGDLVLKETAALLDDAAGGVPDGQAGRWGGEEFFVILPNTGSEDAMSIAEALRKRVENHDFPDVGHLTISLGVITVSKRVNAKDMFLRVDKALYDAKEGGRNCIVKVEM
ncbi:diguanylate cyclase [Butyrivibrio sp. INlla16]|uniref:sensor domain-containing diguanylate cyclase n=1 Tax=Butyrivibrio sp. INlla16 TaxID=1520807 RepID=UPI00087EAF76|nr:diguanylate cyclase [Butyrivibrio sp. INlla16]SDB66933.1 diguanylate cyclase (GGDEF) domain-containing protein [Butyrivibrio sp. INlla16]